MFEKTKTRPVRRQSASWNYLWLMLTVLCGVLLALVILVIWPSLSVYTETLDGNLIISYFSRATAIIGYVFLWISTALGLVVSDRFRQSRNLVNWHQVTSMLGWMFAAAHALVLLGNTEYRLTLAAVLTPFGLHYKPVENALGQIALYVWLIIMISFYVRKWIGRKTWRVIHYTTFAGYLMSLVHGVLLGSDTTAILMQSFYWVSGGIFLFLLIYRLLSVLLKPVEIPLPVSGK